MKKCFHLFTKLITGLQSWKLKYLTAKIAPDPVGTAIKIHELRNNLWNKEIDHEIRTLKGLSKLMQDSRIINNLKTKTMSNIVSKFQLSIDNGLVTVQPIHVINEGEPDYEPIVFTVDQLTDGKVEFEHDGFSNWSHKVIPNK